MADSDLAVVGVLSDVHEHREEATNPFTRVFREGRITVEEVVFGAAQSQQALSLKWTDGGSGEGLAHQEHAGRRIVWLLETKADGSVRADYPWRLIRLCEGDLKTVRRVLSRLKSSERDEKLERLASIVGRPSEYECEHHLWEGNW